MLIHSVINRKSFLFASRNVKSAKHVANTHPKLFRNIINEATRKSQPKEATALRELREKGKLNQKTISPPQSYSINFIDNFPKERPGGSRNTNV